MSGNKINVNGVTFSSRARSMLQKLGIKYLHELEDYSAESLRDVPGMGCRTLEEIEHKMAYFDLYLSSDAAANVLVKIPKLLDELKILIRRVDRDFRSKRKEMIKAEEEDA
jgi:DNA-directed RNA polymerase alpha subunit